MGDAERVVLIVTVSESECTPESDIEGLDDGVALLLPDAVASGDVDEVDDADTSADAVRLLTTD